MLDERARSTFSRSVYRTEFGEGQAISDATTLAALIEALGLNSADVIERAQSADNKERLKAECARAIEIGLPGAPCLITSDGEIFWGNDRLEEALDWARGNE